MRVDTENAILSVFTGSKASHAAVASALSAASQERVHGPPSAPAAQKARREGGERAAASSSSSISSATSSEPPNFSQLDTSASEACISKNFPKFRLAQQQCIEVTVHAGQMLYMPAGWFHEVFSSNDGNSSGHCAFNLWFHPPDNLTEFEKPYESDFWHRDMQSRAEERGK